jgi:hypothetical protein
VLVIHADEVKAAHGATVGQLDPTALFYLRSPRPAARRGAALLTAAFCREPLAAIARPAAGHRACARIDRGWSRPELRAGARAGRLGTRARRLPAARARGPRQAAGVPGLGQHRSEAGGGDRAVDDFYRCTTPTSAARCMRWAARPPKPTRRARASSRRSSTCGDELVLCSGTTFAINLVAYSWALPRLRPGDAILLTRMEHHANIVPWQLVAERTGATIKVAEITPDGALDLDALRAQLTARGEAARAHPRLERAGHGESGARDLPRGAPPRHRHRGRRLAGAAAPRGRHRAIGCDFYAFTGHKMCGPTGTGALWARREHLDAMPPFLGGGEMIREVRFEGTTFNDPPHRFEAGTPNIAGTSGWARRSIT